MKKNRQIIILILKERIQCLHNIIASKYCNREWINRIKWKVVNGREAERHSIPWQVALVDKIDAESAICGGMILNRNVILTAAHCVDFDAIKYKNDYLLPWYVLTGLHDFTKPWGKVAHKICKVLLHEKWISSEISYTNKDYDFALLYLKTPIRFDYKQRPVCLNSFPRKNFFYGKKLQVSGWGGTEKRRYSEKLLTADVDAIADSACERMYSTLQYKNENGRWIEVNETTITDRMICAGDLSGGNRDTCQGDSGGKNNFNLNKKSHLHKYILTLCISI